MKLTKTETEFVEPARVARLATVDSKGICTTCRFARFLPADSFYFGTEASAKKVRNIQANANVALVFDDYTECWSHLRGLLIQGSCPGRREAGIPCFAKEVIRQVHAVRAGSAAG